MYLAIIGLVLDSGLPEQQLDAQLLIDALWAGADRDGPVEHISAVTGPGDVDVGFYIRAGSQAEAEQMARDLLEHATLTVPLLRGWRIRPPPGDRNSNP